MINPLCKFALCAIGPLLITVPATAADLVPYNNGYIPEPYGTGPAGAYSAPPDGNYGAESYSCDPNSEPPEGGPGPCVPGHPYPAAVLPNGGYGPYPYQGSYGAGPPPPTIGPNDRYGDYSDRRGYGPAIPPSDRYGDYSSQPGYGPGRIPPAVAPEAYPDQRSYGPDNSSRYSRYPVQGGGQSAQPNYRTGSAPSPALSGENSNPNGYARNPTARYGGYPAQSGNPSVQPSYRSDSTPPALGGENPGYGPDSTVRYGGYPPHDGYGPERLPTPPSPGGG